MSICSEFRELVETIVEDLEDLLDGTCLTGPDDEEEDKRVPNPGDIIGVDRGMYQHYGIYAGDDRVIHYTAETSDLDPENAEIQETSLERFLRDDTECFIVEAEEEATGKFLEEILSLALSSNKGRGKSAAREENGSRRIFTPEDTVKRARSRIGERNYNLLTNNCEHFAVWCKTGISESRQVRQWVALGQRVLLNTGLIQDDGE